MNGNDNFGGSENKNKSTANNFTDEPDKTTENPIVIADSGGPSSPDGGNYPKREKRPKAKRGITRGFVAAAVALCVVLSGIAGFGGSYLGKVLSSYEPGTRSLSGGASGKEDAVIYKSAPAGDGAATAEPAGINSISAVAASVAGSVVEITTETMKTDAMFGQYITDGAGSGVIITENGYILTCAHVIDGASTITVKLSDGTQYTATLVGKDSYTDVAILKVDAKGLPFVTIGDSDKLVVGQEIVAIGNPLGELGGTVTNGIISALNREVEIDNQTYNLLQTNAAINPGNSGGGMFNLNSELVGLVNAKSSGTGIEGLGFAIPINDAMKVAEELINYGYIKGRPQLGIMAADVNEGNWRNVRSEFPALVNYVTTPGIYFLGYQDTQTAGDLQYGDRIIAIDGNSVSTVSEIKSLLVSEYKIGDTVTVTVARMTDLKTQRSKMIDVSVTLIESSQPASTSPETPETTD